MLEYMKSVARWLNEPVDPQVMFVKAAAIAFGVLGVVSLVGFSYWAYNTFKGAHG